MRLVDFIWRDSWTTFVALATSCYLAHAAATGVLETPAPSSTQSGIGVVSGWHCSARTVEFVIDGIYRVAAGTRTDRADTTPACGRSDTGFSSLYNWNLLPVDCFGCRFHRIQAFADGVQFAEAQFEVEHFRTEFLTGRRAEYSLPNFPELGSATWLRWDEAQQNFAVYLTARNQLSVSGMYYGALVTGATNPACGPFPIDRTLPAKHGNFVIDSSAARISLTARFVDGSVCVLPSIPIAPLNDNNVDGYVTATYDKAATSSCPDLPEGLRISANGTRIVAASLDNCRTINIYGGR